MAEAAIDYAGIDREFGEGLPPSWRDNSCDPGGDESDDQKRSPFISNARLGLLVFLGMEAMFFAGLIGAFFVFRFGRVVWPPPLQPLLPVTVTGINTVILLLSGFTMRLAKNRVRDGDREGLIRWLLMTALLGATFLGIQGYEWVRLVHFGLTMSSSIYGATFYTLIGFHGLHVFGAMVWLLTVLIMAKKRRFSAHNNAGVDLCGMYWYFVVGLWPVLFMLVYLH